MLAAHAVNAIPYLIRKQFGDAKAKRTISIILTAFRVATIDGPARGPLEFVYEIGSGNTRLFDLERNPKETSDVL